MRWYFRHKRLSECSLKTQEKHFIKYLLMYDRMEEFEMVQVYVDCLNELWEQK